MRIPHRFACFASRFLLSGIVTVACSTGYGVAPSSGLDTRYGFVGASYTGGPSSKWDSHKIVSCVAIGPHWVLASGHGGVGGVISFEPDGSEYPKRGIRVDSNLQQRLPGTDLVLVHTLDRISSWVSIADRGPSCGFRASVRVAADNSRQLTFEAEHRSPEEVVWVGYGPGGEPRSDGSGYQIAWRTKGQRHAVEGRADCDGTLPGNLQETYAVWGSFLMHSGDPVVNGGDSGGALLVRRMGKIELVGIISYRLGSGNEVSDGRGVQVVSMAADVTSRAHEISGILGRNP